MADVTLSQVRKRFGHTEVVHAVDIIVRCRGRPRRSAT